MPCPNKAGRKRSPRPSNKRYKICRDKANNFLPAQVTNGTKLRAAVFRASSFAAAGSYAGNPAPRAVSFTSGKEIVRKTWEQYP
jgi:hypothetical protein